MLNNMFRVGLFFCFHRVADVVLTHSMLADGLRVAIRVIIRAAIRVRKSKVNHET